MVNSRCGVVWMAMKHGTRCLVSVDENLEQQSNKLSEQCAVAVLLCKNWMHEQSKLGYSTSILQSAACAEPAQATEQAGCAGTHRRR